MDVKNTSWKKGQISFYLTIISLIVIVAVAYFLIFKIYLLSDPFIKESFNKTNKVIVNNINKSNLNVIYEKCEYDLFTSQKVCYNDSFEVYIYEEQSQIGWFSSFLQSLFYFLPVFFLILLIFYLFVNP